VAFDPNQMTPSGLTYAQIDAREAEYVGQANEALASLRDRGCRWWAYVVSHRTFELVVGEPHGSDNLVISLAACEYVGGPVGWPNQRLRVVWHNDREADKPWVFVLEDESVGFRAVGGVFGWRRGYDLLAQGGLWFGRGAGPSASLNAEQAEEAMAKLLRHFHNGMLGYTDLKSQVCGVLDQLPVVKSQAGSMAE
jgi:hypothetical protein